MRYCPQWSYEEIMHNPEIQYLHPVHKGGDQRHPAHIKKYSQRWAYRSQRSCAGRLSFLNQMALAWKKIRHLGSRAWHYRLLSLHRNGGLRYQIVWQVLTCGNDTPRPRCSGRGRTSARMNDHLLANDPNVCFNPLAVGNTSAIAATALSSRCAPEPDVIEVIESIGSTACIR